MSSTGSIAARTRSAVVHELPVADGEQQAPAAAPAPAPEQQPQPRAPRPEPAEATVAFGAFLSDAANTRRTSGTRRLTCALSIAAHAGLLVAAVIYTQRTIEPVRPPAVAVTILRAPRISGPPPSAPPAPRPAAAARPRRILQPRVVQPPPEVAPQPAPEPEIVAEAATDVAPAGVAGGAAGAGPLPAIGPAAPAPRPPEISPAERKSFLARYLADIVRTRIGSRFRYPAEAEQLGIEGTVVVTIKVDRSGKLLALGIVGRCAHELLCDAAQRTVREAAPFPPPPPELGGTIEVEVPLVYRLQ